MNERNQLRLPWRQARSRKARAGLQEFAGRLATRALALLEPGERKAFLEDEIRQAFEFRRVSILLRPEHSERFSPESKWVRDLLSRVVGILHGTQKPFLNEAVGRELGYTAILGDLQATYAFPIGTGTSALGLLLIDSSPMNRLDAFCEELLLTLCGQVAVVLENSQLLKARLDLQHTLARQAQMVQLGEMTARIAHEIKNPLSSIKTIVQVMQEDARLQPQYGRDLELVRNEIDRLAASVVQLLEFAKPVPEQQEAVRLRDTVGWVLDLLRREIEKGKVVVTSDIRDDLPPVLGNVAVFREILLNLLLNAVQAGGEGSQVLLRAAEGVLEEDFEHFVSLSVEDDGAGVPPEIREKIFQPFFTTRQRGTGLGLAIVKRNVEHLGGQIHVESPARAGRGTRFVIHLPVAGPASESP